MNDEEPNENSNEINSNNFRDNADFTLKSYKTDFIVQEFNTLIKVQDCSYVNESMKSNDFYHCPCSEDFSPICKECASTCHKDHKPVPFGIGNFECFCGKGNHIVQVFQADQSSPCFYHKFFNIIPHKMNNPNYEPLSVSNQEKAQMTLCAVCEFGCKNNGLTLANYEENIITGLIPGLIEEKAYLETPKKNCHCHDNHNFNPIQINGRFLQNEQLKDKMLNFNFNIMFKTQQSKKLYIESLNDNILQYISKKSSQSNYDFFSSWINFKTLEMCSLCFKNWKTKYTSICPFFNEIDSNDLLHLLQLPIDFKEKITQETLDLNFFTSKLYYAELLFNYFIKSVIVKTNNLFSMKTILNMTLQQRLLYIHQAKNFFLFTQETQQKQDEWNFIDDVVKEILSLFKKIKECENLNWKFFETAFSTFNRIMKYLIKFNLISKEQRTEFLEILLDTLHLFLKKKGESLQNTSLSIVKILVYCIVYANDERAFQIIGMGPARIDSDKKDKNKFAFIINDYNMKVSKIFLHIIQHKNDTFTVSQKLHYDYCIKKINEMMLFTRDTYFFSLCKSKYDSNDLLQKYDNRDNSFYSNVISQINPESYETLKKFTSELSNQSQKYFQYESMYELYLSNIILIFSDFRNYYNNPQSYRNHQPISSSDYVEFQDDSDIIKDENSPNHLKDLFCAGVKIFPFFQRIDELIFIFSKGKQYHPYISNTIYEDMNEVFLLIIQMYEDLLKSDRSLINLLMNTNPSIFIEAFHKCPVHRLFSLLNTMADICIEDIQLQAYDSFYFFTGCIRTLLKLHNDDLIFLPWIIKFSSKIMRKSFQKEGLFLTTVEDYSVFFQHLSKRRPEYKEFFNKDNNFTPENKTKYTNFYSTYFGFLSDLMDYDIFFFDYLQHEIVDIDDVYKEVLDNPNMEFKLLCSVMRYYFLKKLSFNFKVTNCQNEIKILFKENYKELKEACVPFINLWNNDGRLTIDIQSLETMIKTLTSFIQLFDDRMTKKSIGAEILYEAYEHTILRPIFKLINISYLKVNLLTGVYISSLYYLILSFIDLTLKLYKKDIYSIKKHDFSVKNHLTVEEKERLQTFQIELKENVQYLELDKIVMYFTKVMKIIKKNKEEKNEKTIIQELLLNQDYTMPTFGSIDDQQAILVSKYLEKKKKCSGDHLVLIKAFYLLESEIEIDVRSHIITYFCDKFFSSITERSKERKDAVVLESEEYAIENVKIQNIYSLLFLNKYFSHDCGNFQIRFMEKFLGSLYAPNKKLKRKKCLDLFLSCLSLKLIFPCILNEIEKIYSLDIFDDQALGKNFSISYKSSKYALKFIQNICEGYNTDNQSYLFGSKFEFLQIQDENNENQTKEILLLTNYSLTSIKSDKEEPNLYNYLSFFNFLCCNMRLINQNLYHVESIQRDLFKKLLTDLNSLDNIKGLHKGLSDLIVEMIQGTNSQNFDIIYTDPSVTKKQIPDISGKIQFNQDKDSKTLMNDIFHCIDTKGLLNLSFKALQNRQEINRKNSRRNQPYAFMNLHKAMSEDKNEKEEDTSIMNTLMKRKSNFEIQKDKMKEHFKNEELAKNKTEIRILFQLMMSIFETRDILNDEKDLFNKNTLDIKTKTFIIINNIINQDSVNADIIEFLSSIFNMGKLINIAGILIKGLYRKWVDQNTKYKNLNKNEYFDYTHYMQLSSNYETNEELFKDQFFKLVSQIYLFITIMGEKYNKPEAKEIIGYRQKVLDTRIKQQTSNRLMAKIRKLFKKEKNEMIDTHLDEKYYICMFLGTYIKKCEFKENHSAKLLTLHFVVDPHSFYISESSKKDFLSNVDRKSSTTKLTALINAMDIFMEEIEEKNKRHFNYKELIKRNFILSLMVNCLMLFFLTGIGTDQKFLKIIITFLIIFQLLYNIYFILIFLLTKYGFYVKMAKKKYKSKSNNKILTPWTYSNIYILEPFLFNNEIFLINFIFVLGLLGLFSKYPLFYYVSQLLTVIAFVPTIKEIVIAFKMRFAQLFCMIGFLFILLYFYANIGFYFYIGEFNAVVETISDNYCQTMVECTLTYFNHGVRSGGGIGDVLGDKQFSPAGLYYLRLTTDMIFYITVILLLLNMINGVIVSTFSQIREESSAKEEDEQNKCFICNIGRKAFEKRKIDFDIHRKEEHNINTYIDFFVMIKKMNEKDLDKVQAEINNCLKKKETYSFPVKSAKSIGRLEDGEEED